MLMQFLGKDALYSVSVEVCDIQSWALLFQALTISVSNDYATAFECCALFG